MKTLQDKAAFPHASRIGEEIVHTASYSASTPFESSVVAIYTVDRVTKTKLFAKRTDGSRGASVMEFPANEIPSSPAQLLVARDVLRRERERNAERKAAQALRESDPKFPYLERVKCGDFEPWDRLSLDQLMTIIRWLDAVREGAE